LKFNDVSRIAQSSPQNIEPDQVLGNNFVWEIMGRRSNTIIKAGNENYSFLICNFQHFPSCDRNDAEPL